MKEEITIEMEIQDSNIYLGGILLGELRIDHYKTEEIDHNWKVYIGENYIGDLHYCDEMIGGWLGDHFNDYLLPVAGDLAEEWLESRVEK